jgi:hypothetical protein
MSLKATNNSFDFLVNYLLRGAISPLIKYFKSVVTFYSLFFFNYTSLILSKGSTTSIINFYIIKYGNQINLYIYYINI